MSRARIPLVIVHCKGGASVSAGRSLVVRSANELAERSHRTGRSPRLWRAARAWQARHQDDCPICRSSTWTGPGVERVAEEGDALGLELTRPDHSRAASARRQSPTAIHAHAVALQRHGEQIPSSGMAAFCPPSHPLTPANTVRNGKRSRACRTCRTAWARRRRATCRTPRSSNSDTRAGRELPHDARRCA